MVNKAENENFEKIGFTQSLKFRLTLFALAIALVPLILMTVITTTQSRTSLAQMLKSDMLTTANAEGIAMGDWLQEQVNHISFLAKLPQLQSLDQDQYAPVLMKAHEDMPAYGLFYFIGPDGKQFYKTDQSALVDLSEREYFKRAMKGETLIGDATVSKSNGRLIIPVAAPVKNADGKVIAVIAGSLYLDTLSTALQDAIWRNRRDHPPQ
jgi:methyl-accepting chemotaxis protein